MTSYVTLSIRDLFYMKLVLDRSQILLVLFQVAYYWNKQT